MNPSGAIDAEVGIEEHTRIGEHIDHTVETASGKCEIDFYMSVTGKRG